MSSQSDFEALTEVYRQNKLKKDIITAERNHHIELCTDPLYCAQLVHKKISQSGKLFQTDPSLDTYFSYNAEPFVAYVNALRKLGYVIYYVCKYYGEQYAYHDNSDYDENPKKRWGLVNVVGYYRNYKIYIDQDITSLVYFPGKNLVNLQRQQCYEFFIDIEKTLVKNASQKTDGLFDDETLFKESRDKPTAKHSVVSVIFDLEDTQCKSMCCENESHLNKSKCVIC